MTTSCLDTYCNSDAFRISETDRTTNRESIAILYAAEDVVVGGARVHGVLAAVGGPDPQSARSDLVGRALHVGEPVVSFVAVAAVRRGDLPPRVVKVGLHPLRRRRGAVAQVGSGALPTRVGANHLALQW